MPDLNGMDFVRSLVAPPLVVFTTAYSEYAIDGFKVDADLSLTQSSRQLHEEIKAGLITKMSWSFIVTADAYDSETHTRSILKVKKVYDVSAVSIPADADTDISARSYCDGVIQREQAERLARRKRILSMTIDSVIGGNEQ